MGLRVDMTAHFLFIVNVIIASSMDIAEVIIYNMYWYVQQNL